MLGTDTLYMIMKDQIHVLDNSWIHSARYFDTPHEMTLSSDPHQDHIHNILSGRVGAHHDTIKEYTRESSNINVSLMTGDNHEMWAHHIKALDSMFSGDAARSTGDFSIYHGTLRSPAECFADRYHTRGIFGTKAYLSGSTSLDVARGFTGYTKHPLDSSLGINYNHIAGTMHIIKVNLKHGSPAVSLRSHSTYPHEHEILVDRGGVYTIPHSPRHIGDDTYLWDANFVRTAKF